MGIAVYSFRAFDAQSNKKCVKVVAMNQNLAIKQAISKGKRYGLSVTFLLSSRISN